MHRIFFFLLLLHSLIFSQTESCFIYKVTISDPKSETFEINLLSPKIDSQTITFGIPVWSPGAYSINNYWEKIVSFKAFDSENNELEVERIDSIKWSVKNARSLSRIEYKVKDFDDADFLDTSELDSTFGYYNGTAVYLLPIGYENFIYQVKFDLPNEWTVATSLDSIAHNHFLANGYDELADSPVLMGQNLQRWDFSESGIAFSVIIHSKNSFMPDSLISVIKEIVKSQVNFFADTPITKYKFLFHFNDDSEKVLGFYGAIEHLNSSAYYLPDLKENETNVRNSFISSTISHEFFHIWNVKLIRPKELFPFNYFEPVKTDLIWFSEGITEYYSNLLMVRNGIITEKQFLRDILNKIETSYLTQKIDEGTSLSNISTNAPFKTFYSFYSKGALVGFYLDLNIRKLTDNKVSLDDVMKSLNQNYGKRGIGFTEKDLISIIESFVRTDMTDFFETYAHSDEDLPHDYYLSLLGLTRYGIRPFFGFHLSMDDSSNIVIDYVQDNSPSDKFGIKERDVLLSINDLSILEINDNVDLIDSVIDIIERVPTDKETIFKLKRGNQIVTKKVIPILKEKELRELENVPDITVKQLHFRRAVLYDKQ